MKAIRVGPALSIVFALFLPPLRVAQGASYRTLFSLTGAAPGDQFGVSVSGAGDVNGDGYADVIVGANLDDAGLVRSYGLASRPYGLFGCFRHGRYPIAADG